MRGRMEKRHFAEDSIRLNDPQFCFVDRSGLFENLAAAPEDDPDVLNRFAFSENGCSWGIRFRFEQSQQLLALASGHSTKQRALRQSRFIFLTKHQIPPRTVARPTRPIPIMYAAVRSETCFSWARFQTRSKLSTITRSSSLRTRARSQLKCWRFWTHSK